MAGASDSTDKIVYGLALVVALIALGIAISSNLEDEEDPVVLPEDPVRAARDRAAAEERRTKIELEAPRGPSPTDRRADPDIVPDLPEVPDLATQPPPPRAPASADDPRMESLAAEMRILSRARELLGIHPSEALGVIRQHRRQFPHGALREEREAFAIEALLALEHTLEAERRYYDFLRDFPASEHRVHLRSAMLRPPHRVGAGGR